MQNLCYLVWYHCYWGNGLDGYPRSVWTRHFLTVDSILVLRKTSLPMRNLFLETHFLLQMRLIYLQRDYSILFYMDVLLWVCYFSLQFLVRKLLFHLSGLWSLQGREPFVSYEGLEQLHRFLFVLGITHVLYSCVAVGLAMIKVLFPLQLTSSYMLVM